MSYQRIPVEKTQENIEKSIEDVLYRKEFYQYHWDPERNFRDPNEYDALSGKFLKIHSHQLFVRNFINPNTPYKRILLKHQTGTGKCWRKNTPILMYSGKVKKVQNIVVGDLVMGDDSTPRKVIHTTSGIEQMYEIKVNRGHTFYCNESHILCLKNKYMYFNMSVANFMARPPEFRANCRVYFTGVEFAPKKTHIDPYLMGFLISIQKNIIPINSYILSYLANELPKYGCYVNYADNYYIERAADGENNIFKYINYGKIPYIYKCNSRDVRLAVLAGIIDVLGTYIHIHKKYIIEPPCAKIRKDILFLCRSLGFRAFSINGAGICINAGDFTEIPVKIRENIGHKLRPKLESKFTITKATTGHYYGFAVDGNHKYLLPNFMVVHNSIAALSIAQAFIDVYKRIYNTTLLSTGTSRRAYIEADKNTPNVFILGFTKTTMIKELLKYPEFGFISIQERDELNKLQELANTGIAADVKRYKEFFSALKRRITTKSKGGFYKFFGYQEFVNRLFISDEVSLIDLETIAMQKMVAGESPVEGFTTLENTIKEYIENKKIQINVKLLEQFDNSLLICDEIHNVYNSYMKNNYGVAIQFVLDSTPNMRAVFMSATPINNYPTEAVDLLNLLLPADQKITKSEFFEKNMDLKPGAAEKLGQMSYGRISFLQDINPRYFPERTFIGEIRKLRHKVGQFDEIPYLYFTPCPMAPVHLATYKKFLEESEQNTENRAIIPTDSYTLYDMVFPSPESEEIGLFRSAETRAALLSSPEEWRTANNVYVNKTHTGGLILSGEWLRKDNIVKYSTKYAQILRDIDEIFDNTVAILKGKIEDEPYTYGSKIMIFHDRVKMSGVIHIQELLRANGFIDELSEPVDNTRCTICGGENAGHKKFIKDNGISDHRYYPSRFVIVHSDIQKNIVESSVIKFNAPENCFGTNYKILIGSKLVRESYDIKDVQDFILVSSPVHISALIQTYGRTYRKESHANLPPRARKVRIRSYLTTIPDSENSIDTVSPEEYKYTDKLAYYKIIQQIEKEFNKYAIDGPIHRDIIMPPKLLEEYFSAEIAVDKNTYLVKSARPPNERLGPLYYEPVKIIGYDPAKINLDTFSPYGYDKRETDIIMYIIKRLFISQSVWKYDDLWAAIKAPPFGVEMNPKLFSEGNFIIALSNLVLTKQSYIDKTLEREMAQNPEITEKILINMLFDPNERYIYKGGIKHKIEQVAEYYILFPIMERETGPKKGAKSSMSDAFSQDIIIKDIESFMRPVKIKQSIKINVDKWIQDSKAEYNYDVKKQQFKRRYCGAENLRRFIGEFDPTFYMRLVVDIITQKIDGVPKIDKELARLYDKVIEEFDKFGAIIYIGDVLKYKDTAKKFSNGKVVKSADGNKFTSKFAKNTPIGFIDKGSIQLYDSPEWIKVSKVSMNLRTQFIENDIIVGYFDMGYDGQMKFKLRKPVESIRKDAAIKASKNVGDMRLIERGIVCSTKGKKELVNIAEKLGISTSRVKSAKNKDSKGQIKIKVLCEKIKDKLIDLEINEREKDSKYKYFYLWYEEQPRLSISQR